MKPLKIALIVLGAIIVTPLVLAQGVVLYLTANDSLAEAQGRKDDLSTVGSAGARDCVSMRHKRPSEWDIGEEKYSRYVKDWTETCQRAAEADGAAAARLSLAAALFAADHRQESADVLRALAAEGNADALLEIYERHRSFERSDVDVPQIIKISEAGESLRKAAELGHPKAILRYAIDLEQGGIIKRDIDAAAHWMEQAIAKPAKDAYPSEYPIYLGRMLIESSDPDKRARGIRLLEADNRPGARAQLATAIRKDDPVRARGLLEGSLRAWPGTALPPLADMLIKGEGGPEDSKRALKLLQSHSNASAPASINAALGRLYAEGKLVPRDLQKAAELMSGETQWSVGAKLGHARFLTDNPTVKTSNPKRIVYDLTQAASLGEPGAMATLIALKLSPNAQFADKAGGCKLAQQAVTTGDESAKTFLGACAAN
jgi:TPR repeat protein